MYSLDMNERLWRDSNAFELFREAVSLLSQAVSKDTINPSELLNIANMMDDIMQSYEKRYGPIEDPLFFWWFATANAFFLQVGKKLDEVGTPRIGYVVNGYKEAINKHLLYPTFPADMLKIAYENMEQFAGNYDREWMFRNHSKFKPIPD